MTATNQIRERHGVGRVAALLVFAAVAFATPLGANAAKPVTSQPTIKTSVNPVLYGHGAVISGRLKGPSNTGTSILLQQNPYPFAGYVDVGTALTATNGDYSFTVLPRLNTRYRAVAATATPATSAELLQTVKPRVALRLSDSTPARGQKVRFSGSVTPDHDGKLVRIQKRTSTGSWHTIARTRLLDSGALLSRWHRNIRIYSSGAFRVQFLADPDHATGTSGLRSARVH